MKLSKELAKQAKKKGICQDWHNELLSLEDKDAMIDMYLKGIDFCLATNYPDNDFIRKHFKGFMEHKGVFLDDHINIVATIENMPKCACLGATVGCVEVKGFEVCEIFVKNDSRLDIEVKENALVIIEIFDNARIDVQASGQSRVIIYQYGGHISHDAIEMATVKIREKKIKTY